MQTFWCSSRWIFDGFHVWPLEGSGAQLIYLRADGTVHIFKKSYHFRAFVVIVSYASSSFFRIVIIIIASLLRFGLDPNPLR